MKNQPSSRSMLALSLMIFFISDVQGGIGLILSIYLRASLDWDTSQVGLAIATITAAAAVFQIPSGMLVDATSYKRVVLALACSCIMASGFILLWEPSFYFIIFAQSLIGLAASLVPPSLAAITLGLIGKEAFPRRVGVNESLMHSGTIFSMLTIGLIAQLYGHDWIVYGVLFFAFCALIPLSLINPHEMHYQKDSNASQQGEAQGAMYLSELFKTRPLLCFFSVAVIFHLANAAQLPLVGQELALNHPDYDSVVMAACIGLSQLVMVIVAFSLRFVIQKCGRKTLFLYGFCILILRALLFSLTANSYYLLLTELLDGVSAGIFNVVALVIISDLASGTGRFNFLIGALGLSVAVGSSLSNLIGGFIAKNLGFTEAFVSLAVIAILGLFLCSYLMPETKDFKS